MGSSQATDRIGPAQQPFGETLRLEEATEEGLAAILALLNKRVNSGSSAVWVGRNSSMAWAGLKVAAILLAAGVGHLSWGWRRI